MRLILAGGGTGGHIIPNIALAEKLRNNGQLEILYMGSKKGMEKEMVENFIKSSAQSTSRNFKMNFYGITCGKLRRYFSWENFIDFFRLPIGFLQSLIKIIQFKPAVIFCKGGYVSFPITVAGWLVHVPIILHESDVLPGLANKMSAKFATVICVSFEESRRYFNSKKVVVTGNPLREEIRNGSKEKGYNLTKFSKKLPVVLVMGGSLGASFINNLIWESLPELLQNFQIIHICGRGKEKNSATLKKYLHKTNSNLAEIMKHYCSFEYVGENLYHLYAISDMIISRAGANSLAEIAFLEKPSLIIPLGTKASRGDQIINAEVFAKHNDTKVLEEENCDKVKFLKAIEELYKDLTNGRKFSNVKTEKDINLKQKSATVIISDLLLSYENRI